MINRRALVLFSFGVFFAYALNSARFIYQTGGEPWEKSLGVLAGLISMAVMAHSAWSLCPESPGLAPWLGPAMLASSCSFAAWSVAGLSVPLYGLILLGLVISIHRSRPRAAALLALLLSLIRLEGFCVAIAVWIQGRREQRLYPEQNWPEPYIRSVLGLWAVYHIVRFALFSGTALPVWAQIAAVPGTAVAGFGQILRFLVIYFPIPLLVLAGAAMTLRSSEGPLFRLPATVILTQLVGGALLERSELPLYESIAPLLPLVCLLAATGLDTVLGLVGFLLTSRERFIAALGLLLCAARLAWVPLEESRIMERNPDARPPAERLAEPHGERAVERNLRHDSRAR